MAPRTFRLADVQANAGRLRQLLQDHDVEVALVFGSLARAGEGGDLDLAVVSRAQPPDDLSALYDAICALFHADNVDVIPLDRVPFLLRKRALLGGHLLLEKTPGHVRRLVEDVLFDQADFRHAAALVEQRLRARVRGGLSVAERRLDRDRVTAYLSQLDVSVRRLATLRNGVASFEAFAVSEDQRDLVTHHLRIALECVLDICRHFLAVTGVSLPEVDTTNLIELAGMKGLLPSSFAQRIRGMAGVRNAIVHAYVDLDYRAIHAMITTRLSDFDEFARHVLGYLEREEAAPA